MRRTILLFNVPAHGHVNPTLPIVAELASRGHRIVYYDAEEFRGGIERCGAEFRPYPGSGLDPGSFNARAANLARVALFLLDEGIRLLPFALDELDREQPDVVMFDSIALWGMQAARLRRVPGAASISTLVLEGVSGMRTARDYVHLIRQAFPVLPSIVLRRHQLVRTYGGGVFPRRSIFPCIGDVNLVYAPRAFQPATAFADDTFQFIGPSILPSTRPSSDFPWSELDGDRPTVLLSLGTVYHGATEFYQAAFAAFGSHPARFVLAVGDERNLQAAGAVPPNFLVRRHVPQLELLSRVDAFVTHGGMNSIGEALYFGVPLVVVPRQLEQALNGRQVVKSGTGIMLGNAPPYGRVTVAALRAAVERVLGDKSYAEAARSMSDACRVSGGYKEGASIIETLPGRLERVREES